MHRKSSSGVTCAENPIVEFLRPYADTLRVSIKDCAYMRTSRGLEFLRTDTGNISYMRRKSSSGVPCAENPVVECVRPYADTPNWDEILPVESAIMLQTSTLEINV